MKKYRFHLLGLAHLPVTRHFMGCAFTMKIYKLSKMLMDRGHEVFLYGAEGSNAPCTEFIQTHTLVDIRNDYGQGWNLDINTGLSLNYDWRKFGFSHDFNTKKKPCTLKYYQNCVQEISKRKQPDDFLLLTQGVYQKPISDPLQMWLTLEPGIGYRGSFTRFRAFESAYLQNFTYGSEHPGRSINGNYYDRVIPNYFEVDDFPFVPKGERGDYYFYIGRLIERKGVMTAVKTVDAIGGKLIVAGQGEMKIDKPNVEMIGYVGPEERAILLGHAKAVFVPTIYLEAFGGTNVEAQLCGTPVLTTDFGVFPETCIDGVTGFRCNTLNDFVQGALKVGGLNNKLISQIAVQKYSTDAVMDKFQKWFDDLYQLYRSAHEDVMGWHWLSNV